MGLFGLFGKKKKKHLTDIDGNVIKPGDRVLALRYDLGHCKLVQKEDGHFYYRTEATGEETSFAKMIDAASKNQKVRKVFD